MELSLKDIKILEDNLSVIKDAFTIRLVEERLLHLFSEGKLFGTVHTCIGQEFSGVAVARALREGDYVFSNHRCHGHFLAYGGSIEGLIAEIMGKETGTCGGRGGSQHLCHEGFFSNGIQGGIVPLIAGMALAHKVNKTKNVGVVFIGDGTLGEGALYETLNIASKWDIPMLVVLENNYYAQSTSQKETLAGDILSRFEAFDIKTTHSNTWEWEKLMTDVKETVDFVRNESRPAFILVDTYRLKAHSKGDDTRAAEIVAPFIEKDPLNRILAEFENEEPIKSLLAEITAKVDEAVDNADEAKFGTAYEGSTHQSHEIEWENLEFERERVNTSILRALGDFLENDNRGIIIGEDIEGPYGGAFKVTGDLSLRYPGRVRNTPISEAAIAGIGNGLALAGMRPVVEFMFGDFLTLAADQWINHAAKFRYMYNNKVEVPVIYRTPMGGKRGYGPTHSQSIEKHFLGLPGTQVLALHHRYSPALLYKTLFETIDRPTLVIENKILYGRQTDAEAPAGFELVHSKEQFPVSWLRPGVMADVTVIALGGTSLDAEKAALRAFDEEEVLCDLFFPSRLFPFGIDFLAESLEVTGKLLIIEEGQAFASLSSEIIARVAEKYGRNSPVFRRLCSEPLPIPTSRPLEDEVLPTEDKILKAITDFAGE